MCIRLCDHIIFESHTTKMEEIENKTVRITGPSSIAIVRKWLPWQGIWHLDVKTQWSKTKYFKKFLITTVDLCSGNSFHHFHCLLKNIRETLCCKSEWNIYLDYSITLAKKCTYVQTISYLMESGRQYWYQIIHTSLALRVLWGKKIGFSNIRKSFDIITT